VYIGHNNSIIKTRPIQHIQNNNYYQQYINNYYYCYYYYHHPTTSALFADGYPLLCFATL